MALDDVTRRMERITRGLDAAGVAYALVGGQAVALWVATVDPAAVRTTKDVDVLLNRHDLPAARDAARSAGMDYFEIMGVGMFIDREDPNPRHGVHLVWAARRSDRTNLCPHPSRRTAKSCREATTSCRSVRLVEMKLTAFRDQDRVHLRDLIDVGL